MSDCEFFVGTFSSQVSRLVYELMQTKFVDASWRFRSLDVPYYFGGQNQPYRLALYDHLPQNIEEIELKKDDLIKYFPEYALKEKSGNNWNGYSSGVNVRTGKKGIFPTYKTRELIQTY